MDCHAPQKIFLHNFNTFFYTELRVYIKFSLHFFHKQRKTQDFSKELQRRLKYRLAKICVLVYDIIINQFLRRCLLWLIKSMITAQAAAFANHHALKNALSPGTAFMLLNPKNAQNAGLAPVCVLLMQSTLLKTKRI